MLASDPSDGGRVELVVRQVGPEQVAAQAETPQSSGEPRNPSSFAGDSQEVLSGPGVPFDDADTAGSDLVRETHPPFREHAHRAEGQREEPDLSAEQLPVTLSEVGPRPVLDGAAPSREGEWRVDDDEIRARLPYQDPELVV